MKTLNLFPHTTMNIFCQNMLNLYNWMDNSYDWKWKTLWQKEKLLILSNFFFCHYVFKRPSAAKASESVFMRERVNLSCIQQNCSRHKYLEKKYGKSLRINVYLLNRVEKFAAKEKIAHWRAILLLPEFF